MSISSTKSKSMAVAFFASAIFSANAAWAMVYSIDQASPLIDGNITPDDILTPAAGGGTAVLVQGTSLGLQDDFLGGVYDNLDAISLGADHISPDKSLYFSVDRVSVGLPGTDVNRESQAPAQDAARGIYKSLPPFGSNVLFTKLGGNAGLSGDDVDGFDFGGDLSSIFFSIDSVSASNIGLMGGCGAANIYANNISTIWKSYDTMGLSCNDDLDALALGSGGSVALFSLSPFSDEVMSGRVSAADILYTGFNGSYGIWATAAAIGLLPSDNVDALALIPEPATASLLAIGLCGGGWVGRRRRLRKAAI